MNNPAFYQEPWDFPANSIVGVSNQPTVLGPSNNHTFGGRREFRIPAEPQTQPWPPIAPWDVDVDAYVSRHVDALQFLPSEQPVRLFTLRVSDCTNWLAALLGYVRNGVVGYVRNGVGYGTRQLRSARDLLTGRNAVPGNGRRAVSGLHVAERGDADVANDVTTVGSVQEAGSSSQVDSQNWRARKFRFSAALDTRAHWSFAMYELRAEAEQRRKERKWRDIAALTRDANGQSAASVKVIVEAALRRLTEAPGQTDVTTIIADLQYDLASVQEWLTTERAFTGEYAQAIAAGNGSLSPGITSATRARLGSNPTQNEYARLLEKHPGARRFLRRVAARRTGIPYSLETMETHDGPLRLTEVEDA